MELIKDTPSAIWPSMSFGKIVFLRAHRDEDYFWSLTTMTSKPANDYKINGPILNYFCFPAHGSCVAMRAGDVLLCNACVYHCVSSMKTMEREAFFMSLHVFIPKISCCVRVQ